MSMSAEPVIEYLQHLQAQGQTHISLDDEARLILREFYRRAHNQTGGKATRSQSTAGATTRAESKIERVLQEASLPEQDKAVDVSPVIDVVGNSASEKIENLKKQTARLPAVRALDTLRKTLVFSAGSPSADIMLVGEAPGFDDERIGEPFMGKAGKKLDGILQAMGLPREAAYLTNLVKYRPLMPNQTTMTRKPSVLEIEAFSAVLEQEIEIVAPKVILALGVTTAQYLLGSNASVSDLRGEFHEFKGIPLRVTYHPSYILQDGVTPEKRELWEDMLAVMELLKMPISEKQQGYFSKGS
ncbi:MAG: uracil-DNA glycosylase [Akkermansiaceae bacterium]